MPSYIDAKENLRKAGKSEADLARELNVDRSIVSGVLSGRLKGKRGKAHKVAVAVGIKKGVVTEDSTPVSVAIKLAGDA